MTGYSARPILLRLDAALRHTDRIRACPYCGAAQLVKFLLLDASPEASRGTEHRHDQHGVQASVAIASATTGAALGIPCQRSCRDGV